MRRARSSWCDMVVCFAHKETSRKDPLKGHRPSLWLLILTQRHLGAVPKSVMLSSPSLSSLPLPSSFSSDFPPSSSSSLLVDATVSPSSATATLFFSSSSIGPSVAFVTSAAMLTLLPPGVFSVMLELKLESAGEFFPSSGSTPSSVWLTVLPGRSPLGMNPIIFAGAPTAVAPLGIGLSTTLPAPIFARSPTVMFPNIFVPAPINTSRPILGCRSPCSFPVPPRVTPCSMVVPSPTVAVSPTTTPEA
mmetsp:Transcript_6780/g.16688  ORF Transcript_6780/g.16688 Transcript_6780/m.16688 type:complete len:248 (+) Transcript_6780:1928-2671(+)